MGSDIDGGNLRSASHPHPGAGAVHAPSKNANFKRKDGQSQRSLSVMDNFRHYKLEERVLDLVGAPVDAWLLPRSPSEEGHKADSHLVMHKYDKVWIYSLQQSTC